MKCVCFYGAANKGRGKEGKGTRTVCLPQLSSCPQLFFSPQGCEEHHKRRATQTFRTKGKFWRCGKPLSEVMLLSHRIWLMPGVGLPLSQKLCDRRQGMCHQQMEKLAAVLFCEIWTHSWSPGVRKWCPGRKRLPLIQKHL